MLLQQRLEPGFQSVHGTLDLAQGQRFLEHEAEAEQLQQGSIWTACAIRYLLLC